MEVVPTVKMSSTDLLGCLLIVEVDGVDDCLLFRVILLSLPTTVLEGLYPLKDLKKVVVRGDGCVDLSVYW